MLPAATRRTETDHPGWNPPSNRYHVPRLQTDTTLDDHPEPALLTQARSVFEADVLIGILDEAGIRAYRQGGQLTDEFAISQQMMGLQGVRVYVPEPRLEEARRVLEEADAQGQILQEDSEDPETQT